MPERTDQHPEQPSPTTHDLVDEGLRVLLDQPSYAAQTALTMAAVLDLDATQPMTYLACERVLDIAADTILSRLPTVVCQTSLASLYAALPPIGTVTRGEYALILRAAAREL